VATLLSIAIVALSVILRESEDLSTVLLTVGVVALVASLAKFANPSKRLVYLPTGERVVCVSLNHPKELAERVEHALGSGNGDLLKALAVDQSAPLMTVLYTTPSGSLFAGQTHHYVPYEYKPLTKVYLFTERKSE
jgi:hypothetical protein